MADLLSRVKFSQSSPYRPLPMVEARRGGKKAGTNTLRRSTVSSLTTSRTPQGIATIGARAKDAAAQAVPMGKRAGTTAVQGVRQGVHDAREWAAPRLEDAADAVTRAKDAAAQGVHDAREWAAPRLEDAADAVTSSVAPRVSSALRSTAGQVRPAGAQPGKAGLRRLLSWRWLLGAGAVVAAAGATAAIAMRRRYANATAEVQDDAESHDNESAPTPETASEADTRSSGNGTVPESTKSGR
jgi:hypothetical protein